MKRDVIVCVCVVVGGGGELTALIIKDGDSPDHINVNVRTPTQEKSQIFGRQLTNRRLRYGFVHTLTHVLMRDGMEVIFSKVKWPSKIVLTRQSMVELLIECIMLSVRLRI